MVRPLAQGSGRLLNSWLAVSKVYDIFSTPETNIFFSYHSLLLRMSPNEKKVCPHTRSFRIVNWSSAIYHAFNVH